MNSPEGLAHALRSLVDLDRHLKYLGVPDPDRLHVIGDESGKFLFLQILAARPDRVIEIGTSAGYSTVWLASACDKVGGRLVTVERDAKRLEYARDLVASFGLAPKTDFVCADARTWLDEVRPPWDIALIDGEKGEYIQYFDRLVATPASSARLVYADNLLSHRSGLAPFVSHLDASPNVTHQLIPLGKGIEMCYVDGPVGSDGR